MTPAELRAYGRGYYAGQRNYWPKHKPAMPPSVILAAMVLAATNLRDHAQGWCQVFDQDDELVTGMYPYIDDLDAAMQMLKNWLIKNETPQLDAEAQAPRAQGPDGESASRAKA